MIAENVKPLAYLPWEVDCKRIRWHEKQVEVEGKQLRKFKFTLVLKLGPAMMEFGAIYRGKTAGMVEMPYDNGENADVQLNALD